MAGSGTAAKAGTDRPAIDEQSREQGQDAAAQQEQGHEGQFSSAEGDRKRQPGPRFDQRPARPDGQKREADTGQATDGQQQCGAQPYRQQDIAPRGRPRRAERP